MRIPKGTDNPQKETIKVTKQVPVETKGMVSSYEVS